LERVLHSWPFSAPNISELSQIVAHKSRVIESFTNALEDKALPLKDSVQHPLKVQFPIFWSIVNAVLTGFEGEVVEAFVVTVSELIGG